MRSFLMGCLGAVVMYGTITVIVVLSNYYYMGG